MTSLYLTLSTPETLTRQTFEYYLQSKIRLRRIKFTIVSFSSSFEGTVEVEMSFASINKAKRGRRVISKRIPNAVVSLQGFSAADLNNSIVRYRVMMTTKSEQYLLQHDDKVKATREKLKELQQKSKKLSLDDLERVMSSLKVVQDEIEELQRQKDEFLKVCREIDQKFVRIEASLYSRRNPLINEVEFLQKSFARECIRLHKALPIYARRSDIIATVRASQVAVLIGETGSGKSTQVVQYLFDAGYGNTGLIACTQPRKVAAITLATHVSREMCSSVGEVVGYHLGSTKSTSPKTRIVYMTDHTLLNECIADPLLMKYSCLVIDEAHERSLDTDILLSFIKRSLAQRPELRIIITSATINPDIFVKYFGGSAACPVLRVSGRTFPVDVVWNPLGIAYSPECTPFDNIVPNCVSLVKKIHREEPDGDILVFLSSLIEIETACETAIEELPDAIVLPLHGRLQPDEQRQVFEDSHGVRKIVFSTNVAETSVTIPGIKYIVDSGLAKEMCFDPKRNMNSLEVCLISKSSAEQRKGRAGRVSAGRCYRIYTEDQYHNMRERTPPEILRMHLIHAVLKLYEFGIADILLFDFVEKPDQKTLESAVETLQFLGAVNRGGLPGLTDLGRRLALLPIDPQLGKVLLDGIAVGVGLEAAVSVAISSYSSNLFYRAGKEEVKRESDRMKIQFVHSGGDQMMCLSVYKKWSSCKREERNRWCVQNYINAKSMRLVEETVKELRHVLFHSFGINLPAKLPSSLSLAESTLRKLYFFAFLRNLAVYLGHPWIGYMITAHLSSRNDPLVPFPGSSLVQCNETPKYVIYEKTLKTSKNFLLQVLSVEEDWIIEAISLGKLSHDPADDAAEYMVSPVVMDMIGQIVASKVISRNEIKGLTEHMRSLCGGAPVQVDLSQLKLGRVSIYSSKKFHNCLREFLSKRIRAVRDDLRVGFIESGVTRPDDDVRVVLGRGGAIEHVLMPHQYRTIVVKGPSVALLNEVVPSLTDNGTILSTQLKEFKNEAKLLITYSKPSMAVHAVSTLTDVPKGVTISPQLQKSSGSSAVKYFRLKVEWVRRERQEFGFITFSSNEDFIEGHSRLGRSLIVCGLSILLKPSNKNPLQIFIPKLDKNIAEADIRNALDIYLQDIDYKLTFGHEKSFETNPEILHALEYQLKHLLLEYASEHQFIIRLLPPAPHHITYRANVDFPDPSVGQMVLRQLSGKTIAGKPLQVELVLCTSVRFSPEIYSVIADEVSEVRANIELQFSKMVKFVQKPDRYCNVIVEIQSVNVEAFGAAKNLLNSLTLPVIKECWSPLLRHYILSKTSRKELGKIQQDTTTVIVCNTRSMTISIYGSKYNQEQARRLLDEQIHYLESRGILIHEIHLKGSGKPPGLMKHIVTKYGVDLTKMLSLEGVESATLEPQKQVLTVFSSNDAFEHINKVIVDYSASTPKADSENLQCSICLCEIEDASEVFLLECCGHASHIQCIEVQVSANAVTFPLQCSAEDCSEWFVWQDCENLFKRTSLRLTGLVELSLKSFLGANKDKARPCPTPDCQMVYAVSDDGQRFVCSHCNVQICTTCHVQYHDGLTCAMYRSGEADEGRFKKWLQADPCNRKQCPKCTIAIEKIEGCNKMHCTQCRSHICWVCLKYYDDEQDCYKHLQNKHGGSV